MSSYAFGDTRNRIRSDPDFSYLSRQVKSQQSDLPRPASSLRRSESDISLTSGLTSDEDDTSSSTSRAVVAGLKSYNFYGTKKTKKSAQDLETRREKKKKRVSSKTDLLLNLPGPSQSASSPRPAPRRPKISSKVCGQNIVEDLTSVCCSTTNIKFSIKIFEIFGKTGEPNAVEKKLTQGMSHLIRDSHDEDSEMVAAKGVRSL